MDLFNPGHCVEVDYLNPNVMLGYENSIYYFYQIKQSTKRKKSLNLTEPVQLAEDGENEMVGSGKPKRYKPPVNSAIQQLINWTNSLESVYSNFNPRDNILSGQYSKNLKYQNPEIKTNEEIRYLNNPVQYKPASYAEIPEKKDAIKQNEVLKIPDLGLENAVEEMHGSGLKSQEVPDNLPYNINAFHPAKSIADLESEKKAQKEIKEKKNEFYDNPNKKKRLPTHDLMRQFSKAMRK